MNPFAGSQLSGAMLFLNALSTATLPEFIFELPEGADKVPHVDQTGLICEICHSTISLAALPV
jgi:hypothetical protein